MSHFSQWPNQTPQNIIVRMPNWLGDLVMSTPILADLRHKFKGAAITAMAQSNVASLLQHDPNINELFSYKKPNGWIHRTGQLEIIDFLQKGKYDLGILLPNSFSSAWWFWKGGVLNRVGFAANLRSLLLNKALPYPVNMEKQHLVLTYKALLEPLGIPISQTAPKLYVSAQESEAARELLARKGVRLGTNSVIGINPGAAFGSAKCWLPERFREVTVKLLQNPNIQVVYFGDPAGAPLVNEICSGLPDRVINLAGKTTIRELAALTSCCSVFLTNDSGPMHIASALSIPLVALFGSTSDVKTGPYGGGAIIHKRVSCSPCYQRVCPIDFKCMKRIESDEVYEAIIKKMN